jgi:carbon storage regulator
MEWSMLVLTRKANESILIGDGIRINVASIRGRQVRIGIEAPSDVQIIREELLSERATDPTSSVGERDPLRSRHKRRGSIGA